jgi:hypothetical protein
MLASTLIWWPEMDFDIEKHLKLCETCQSVSNAQAVSLQPWPKTTRRLQRIHIDFAQFRQRYFLIIVDSYSNWIDALPVSSIDFSNVEMVLLKFFSDNGLCENLVSDGGPPFNSLNFREFCTKNGISHILSPPYHPQSNGTAERAVQTFKKFAKKILIENPQISNLQFNKKILEYLFAYRNTPCVSTGKCPAELFIKTKCKNMLTNVNPLLQPNVTQSISYQPKKVFVVGQTVFVRVPNSEFILWQKGIVVEKISNHVYKINVEGRGRNYHIDHIRVCEQQKVEGKMPNHNTIQMSLPTPQRLQPQTPINPIVNNMMTPPAPLGIQQPVSPVTPMFPLNTVQPNPAVPLPQGVRRSERTRWAPKRLDL